MGTLRHVSFSLTSKMKTFAIVLALAAVAVAKPDFEACPGFEDNSFVNPWSFTINPDPVMAKEGAEVKIHFDATILKTLPVGTKIDVKMTKSGLPLPCLPISTLPIHIGSCSYEAQELLDLIPAEDCQKFAPAGQECKLPLNPGFYGDSDPNGVKPFIQGEISVTAKAMNADGTEYLCMKNTVKVV